jgi:hypothetical protein
MAQATSLWRKLGDRFTDNSGNALAGGKLFYYMAGTTTLSNTYSDSGGVFANTNPILLDAAGRINVPVYITALNNYKELLTDSNGNTIAPWPMDNIPAAVATQVASSFAFPIITWLQFTSSQSPVSIAPSQGGFGFEASTSGGNVQFNLPSASSIGAGKILWFKKIGAANTVILNPNGTDQIDGVNAAYLLTFNNQAIGLSSDGAEWEVISAVQSVPVIPPGGRLTLTTGVPVINADVAGATTVFYTQATGCPNTIPIWNGTQFNYFPFAADLSLALNGTILGSSSIVDVFAINNNGAPVIAAGPAWSNVSAGSCARGTGAGTTQLARQNGIWTNAVSITLNNGGTAFSNITAGQATYLGSIFGDGTAGQTSCTVSFGQSRKWGLWNAYNRKPIVMLAGDSTASWTSVPASWRASDGNSANSISAFTGLPEEEISAQFWQRLQSNNRVIQIGVGFDSTSSPSGLQASFDPTTGFAGQATQTARYDAPPSLGLNTITSLEFGSADTNATFFGTNANMQLTVSYTG